MFPQNDLRMEDWMSSVSGTQKRLVPVAMELLWQANDADDPDSFLSAALPCIARSLRGDFFYG